MKKIMIAFIVVVCLIGLGIAVNIGDILTSQQVINANAWNEVICTFVDVGVYDGNVVFYFDCMNIKRMTANQYEVVEQIERVEVPKEDVVACINFYGSWEDCLDERLEDVVLYGENIGGVEIKGIRFAVEQIREDINRTQNKASLLYLNSSQISITNQEINF